MQANSMTNEQLMRYAPSIFAEKPFHTMSEKYRFVPTIKVLDAMRDNGFQPVKASQSRTRIEGKGDFTKHMIRFRHNDFMNGSNVGDELPEIVLVNSHDGSSAYQLMAGIFRLVCSNGMVVQSSDMSSISVRHSGKDDAAQQVIDASFEIIDQTPKVFSRIADYKQIELSVAKQEAFAKAALEIKSKEAAETFSTSSVLQARRTADVGEHNGNRDLWRTMNVIQENIIHGGFRGRSVNTRRRTTAKAVNSVNEDVRINRALWRLTDEMAKLAA